MTAAETSGYVAARRLKAGGRRYSAGEPIEPADTFNFRILEETGSVVHGATPKGRKLKAAYEGRSKSAASSSNEGPKFASNQAEELANEFGLTLTDIEGSGSGGNVTKADVEKRVEAMSNPDEGLPPDPDPLAGEIPDLENAPESPPENPSLPPGSDPVEDQPDLENAPESPPENLSVPPVSDPVEPPQVNPDPNANPNE